MSRIEVMKQFKENAKHCSFNYAGGRDELGSAARHKAVCRELYGQHEELRGEMREFMTSQLWADEFVRDIVMPKWGEECVLDVPATIQALKDLVEIKRPELGEWPSSMTIMKLGFLGEREWFDEWAEKAREIRRQARAAS